METLWLDLRLDLRHCLRQLARRPGFAAAVLLTLAVGLGALGAMFLVVHAVLLAALPYRDADRLVVLTGRFADKGETVDWQISQMDFDDWRRENRIFTDLSVWNPGGDLAYNLVGGAVPERLNGELVSASYFPLLGKPPSLGRFFTLEEDTQPFTHYVVVLGHDLWRRRFGGDPGVVGRRLDLNGTPYRVVGIGPPGFRGLTDKADLWVPSRLPPMKEYLQIRRVRWLAAVGRLQPGVTIAQAQAEMDRRTAALARQYPDMNQGIGVRVTALRDHWFGGLRRGLLLLTLGAGVLLLLACINVANLLLTRAVAEERAHAIRLALGANRQRLIRQLLTESLQLSLLGAALGLLVAAGATPALLAASGVVFPGFVRVAATPGVIAALGGVAILCGIVCGLASVWITFQPGLAKSLTRPGQSARRGSGRHRFQSAVVIAQVALALLLATVAGLMAHGFHRMTRQDLGFRTADLLTLRMDLQGPKYAADPAVVQLSRQLLDQLSTLPGVAALAISDPTVPTDDWAGGYITAEDHASRSPDGTYTAMLHSLTPGYFAILGVPLLAGRDFTLEDTQAPVALVSQALADQQWPGQNPLGKRLKLGARSRTERPWMTVVGVVANFKDEGVQGLARPAPDIYMPLLEVPLRLPMTLNLLAHPKPGIPAARLGPLLTRELHALAPDLPVYDVATMEERLARQTDRSRFQIVLIGLFSILALVLAAIGIYGVVAYGVAQQTAEIAVRMSLGADRRRIQWMVLGRGARLAGIGLALGLLAVLALGRSLSGLLYGTSATDPLVLGATALLLFLVTLAANYLPARRAAKLEPGVGLRAE